MQRKGMAMDTSGMVGLMGLTFFCNKCVELFYHFSVDGNLTDELRETCQKAVTSFKSLTGINIETEIGGSEKMALFNTNEEIESFEKALEPGKEKNNLDKLIADLELMICEEEDLDKKKEVASKLQNFFDALGDYSLYASRDCSRNSEDLINI